PTTSATPAGDCVGRSARRYSGRALTASVSVPTRRRAGRPTGRPTQAAIGHGPLHGGGNVGRRARTAVGHDPLHRWRDEDRAGADPRRTTRQGHPRGDVRPLVPVVRHPVDLVLRRGPAGPVAHGLADGIPARPGGLTTACSTEHERQTDHRTLLCRTT